MSDSESNAQQHEEVEKTEEWKSSKTPEPDRNERSEEVTVGASDVLFTCETLDRSSPELWPRQIPGLSEYVSLRSENSQDSWSTASNSKPTSAADIHLMQQLGTLSTSGLIIEVKKLHDLAYQLGMEEAKEMTRGKYLNIFTSRSQR